MKFKISTLGFVLTILLSSCKNLEPSTENPEINTTENTQESKNKLSKIDREAIIKKLQGSWKKPEYPFGVAIFKDTLVKFIEEGVVEPPRFREYRILKECPYEVNNIRNPGSDEIILVVAEAGTCEKLKISNDTLSLSGFNVHTGEDYLRIYKKTE